ncbi:MAG: BON domain-containing protein [Rhodospirillaceae bacterium]|nr:BON domain-containing protein [Rhodospirillaceae bacterium]
MRSLFNINSRGTINILGGLVALLALSACGTQVIITETAKAAFEDRLTEEQVVDAKIKASIINRIIKIDKGLVLDVSVDVWKTRVMMTGTLSDANVRNSVIRAAQEDTRISDFYNNIHIVSEAEQSQRRDWMDKAKSGGQTVSDVVSDVWIETKISAQLISEEGVTSVNYRWRSVLGSVYLIGEASTSSEMNKVLDIISATKGVKSVKSHALLGSG